MTKTMAELIRYLDKFAAWKVQDDHTRLLDGEPFFYPVWLHNNRYGILTTYCGYTVLS